MSGISELVGYQLAQTEQDLKSPDGLSEYSVIKDSCVARAKAELYGSNVPVESQMHDVVKFYLSDVAVLYLIDVAIDWYQNRTVSRQTQGDETYQYYDRISSLRLKSRELRHRISQAESKVKTVAFGYSIGDVAGLPLAEAQERKHVTIDPWAWARYLYGDLIHVRDGIKPKTIVVDRP